MLFLYRVYQICVMLPLMLAATVITALTAIAGASLGAGRWAGYYPERIWSRIMCWLAFVRVRAVGRDNIDPRQSYIFVANHQGAYDIWTIYGFLNHNFKWLMKKELESIFMVGKACRKAGHIMVDDSSIAGIKSTIQESEGTLKGGMSLVIFPEGSRTWDGNMTAFKRGAFMLAGEFKLPVVPITIDGSFRAMPRYTYLMTPSHIRMTIHKPIRPGERGFNTKALMEQCRREIASALPQPDIAETEQNA